MLISKANAEGKPLACLQQQKGIQTVVLKWWAHASVRNQVKANALQLDALYQGYHS